MFHFGTQRFDEPDESYFETSEELPEDTEFHLRVLQGLEDEFDSEQYETNDRWRENG